MTQNVPTAVQPIRRKALASVTKGVQQTPVRVLVYGGEKVGKSTFAAGAPRPVFLGAEDGTERLDVERLQPTTWEEALAWVGDLATDPHEYKTLVVDPLGWFETMVHNSITGGNGSIEEYGGGFGKGYTAAVGKWREMLFALEKCWRARGMNIILVAHSQVKTFNNPEGPAYDRYELAMNAKSAGLLKQWADAVLFARLEVFAKAEKGQKARGFSSGARVIHTSPCAAYDAGARWKLPEQLPLSWDDFFGAVQAEGARGAELLASIAKMVTELGDAQVTSFAKEFTEKNKSNPDRLAELANRIGMKLDTKNKETNT